MLVIVILAIFVLFSFVKKQEKQINVVIKNLHENSAKLFELSVLGEDYIFFGDREKVNEWKKLHGEILYNIDSLHFPNKEVSILVGEVRSDIWRLSRIIEEAFDIFSSIEEREGLQKANKSVKVTVYVLDENELAGDDFLEDSNVTSSPLDMSNTEDNSPTESVLQDFDQKMLAVMEKNIKIAASLEERRRVLGNKVDRNVLFTLAMAGTFLVILNMLTVRPVLLALITLKNGAIRFYRGDFSHTIPVYGDDEVSSVAKAFNKTAKQLDSLYKNLDRKVLERTSELQKFKQAVDSSTDGIMITDEKLEIEYINSSFVSMAGNRKKELIGGKALKLFSGTENYTEIKKDIVSSVIKNKIYTAEDMLLGEKNIPVRFAIYPIQQNKENSPHMFVILVQDISHLKEIDKMKTEFVSIASHQLRTPLTAINWHLEFLLGGEMGKLPDDQEKFLGDVYQSSKRMIKLVNDLLNVSRLETGRLTINPTKVDLVSLIDGVVKEVGPLLRASNCEVTVAKPENMEQVYVDESLIR